MAKKLENKVAVITGGNSGIGLSTAKLFQAEGARVVITGRRQDVVDSAVKEIGGDSVGFKSLSWRMVPILQLGVKGTPDLYCGSLKKQCHACYYFSGKTGRFLIYTRKE